MQLGVAAAVKHFVSLRSLALAMALAPSAIGSQGTEATGTVLLRIVDTFGKPLQSAEIVLTSIDQAGKYRRVLHSSGEVTLPYGRYKMEGRASLHRFQERIVSVATSQSVIVAAFAWHDSAHSTYLYPPLKGRFAGDLKGSAAAIVSMVPLWGDSVVRASIDPKGHFAFDDVPFGDYLMVVAVGGDVVSVSRYRRAVDSPAPVLGETEVK